MDLTTLELLLRGACVGWLILMLLHVIITKPFLTITPHAALIIIGTIAYVIVSSPVTRDLGTEARMGLALFATLNSVFFWWFATALFDDDFRWKVWRFIPFIILLALYCVRAFLPASASGAQDDILQQALIIVMMLHAMWLALKHRRDDLIEPRRRFRLIFVGLIGIMGLIIAIVELSLVNRTPPAGLMRLHALALFGLILGFSYGLTRPLNIFHVVNPASSVKKDDPDFDGPAFKRLERALQAGFYRQESLSIAQLAHHIGYAEYKLRRLINGAMGYRNFNAFINHYRIEEAKRLLSDPAQARLQVTQIAYDLGYGSIAPFNRAFKQSEHMTPSQYRKAMLERDAHRG